MSRVAESEVKYPTFPKFPTPNIRGMKFGCLKSMEIVVHNKKSASTKASKDIESFQQKFPM